MTRFPNLLRLLPVALVLGALALAVACGGGDDTPTPQPTLSITPADEQAIDKAVADVIAGLEMRTRTALDGLANDKLKARPETLDRLTTCFPEGAALSVRNRDIKPGTGYDVRLTINFSVTQNGATQNSRRDWRFEKQADGSFKLSDAPDCPFQRVVPSAVTGESPSAAETETPIGEVPAETGVPVQP